MTVKELKRFLQVFQDDTEVFIQTVPHDLAQPITLDLVSVMPAHHDERFGLNREKLLFTAHIPMEKKA